MLHYICNVCAYFTKIIDAETGEVTEYGTCSHPNTIVRQSVTSTVHKCFGCNCFVLLRPGLSGSKDSNQDAPSKKMENPVSVFIPKKPSIVLRKPK
jgi:hypothetical protein